MAKRNAIIVAAVLEVHCPHCGEPQPSPRCGAHLWEPDEVHAFAGDRICNACEGSFKLLQQSRVNVINDAPMRDADDSKYTNPDEDRTP